MYVQFTLTGALLWTHIFGICACKLQYHRDRTQQGRNDVKLELAVLNSRKFLVVGVAFKNRERTQDATTMETLSFVFIFSHIHNDVTRDPMACDSTAHSKLEQARQHRVF